MKSIKKLILSLAILTLFTAFSSAKFQVLTTTLKVTVIDELGNIVQGAKVTLYKNEEDYRASANPVGEAVLTDEKGQAKFSKLEAIPYFVLAEKEGKANNGAGVQTQALAEGKLNKVNTVIK